MDMLKDGVPIGIILEYIKGEDCIEFFCARCGKRKIAKKYAQFSDNETIKRVCNGCYGNLMSKAKQK